MSNGPWGISMKKLGGQMLGCRWTKLLPLDNFLPSANFLLLRKRRDGPGVRCQEGLSQDLLMTASLGDMCWIVLVWNSPWIQNVDTTMRRAWHFDTCHTHIWTHLLYATFISTDITALVTRISKKLCSVTSHLTWLVVCSITSRCAGCHAVMLSCCHTAWHQTIIFISNTLCQSVRLLHFYHTSYIMSPEQRDDMLLFTGASK